MLINVKAVKTKIKAAGFRIKKEVPTAFDRKVAVILDTILTANKSKKTLRAEDIL